MSNTRFYFARLDFTAQVTSVHDDNAVGSTPKTRLTLEEYLEDREQIIAYDGDEWRPGATNTEYDDFIVGQFGKLYDERPETYDEDQGAFVQDSPEEVAESSMFLIDPEHQFIAFNQRQRIGYHQFTGAFAEGYNRWSEIPEALSLPFLTPTGELEYIMNETTVRSVNFDLEPTNPFPEDAFQELDEELHSMNAKEAGIDAEGAAGGLNPENDLLESALAFAESEYGDVFVIYEEDGERNEFNTKERPASTIISKPQNLEELVARREPIINRGRELVR